MKKLTGIKLLLQLKQAPDPSTLLRVLELLSQIPLTRPLFIKEYHEQLLFLSAFPYSPKIHSAVNKELKRVALAVKQSSPALYNVLSGDGIINTELICSYSFSLTIWLSQKFTQAVSLHSSFADADTVRNILQLICPFAEFEKTTQDEMKLGQRIATISAIKNKQAQLNWLLRAIDESNLPLNIKEEMFRQLQVFVQWKITKPQYSRTFLKFSTENIYYQKKSINQINTKWVLNKKINLPVKLTTEQKGQLCDTLKTSLALLSRETDPVTFADEQAVQLFNMGRGFSIALVYLKKDRRLSLESYIGYMAFKNGIPVSYGGGWILGTSCKIGVNIYPAFRKGESAWMFCQVLRLYHQNFKVSYFYVNPYQFGKGNPEGLKSGAFWFYYRLGFRPVQPDINVLSKTEWKKINTDKKYRTPVNILKKFTAGPVSLHLNKNNTPAFFAPEISTLISNYINKHFNSNRKAAIQNGYQKLKTQFQLTAKNETLSLLYLLADKNNSLSLKEKKELANVFMLQYNNSEAAFIKNLQKCSGFWKLLNTQGQK